MTPQMKREPAQPTPGTPAETIAPGDTFALIHALVGTLNDPRFAHMETHQVIGVLRSTADLLPHLARDKRRAAG